MTALHKIKLTNSLPIKTTLYTDIQPSLKYIKDTLQNNYHKTRKLPKRNLRLNTPFSGLIEKKNLYNFAYKYKAILKITKKYIFVKKIGYSNKDIIYEKIFRNNPNIKIHQNL